MHALAEIVKSVEKDGDTWLVVRLPKNRLKEEIENKTITNTEMRFDDGRHISNLQRKKAYATIRDIAIELGYLPERDYEMQLHDRDRRAVFLPFRLFDGDGAGFHHVSDGFRA